MPQQPRFILPEEAELTSIAEKRRNGDLPLITDARLRQDSFACSLLMSQVVNDGLWSGGGMRHHSADDGRVSRSRPKTSHPVIDC